MRARFIQERFMKEAGLEQRAWRKGKSVLGGVKKLKRKFKEKGTPALCSRKKYFLCLLFSYMKRTVCSFVSFQKSQHTNPGGKNLKHTERSKTHHDIFSFALNLEFGTFFLVWMLPQAPDSLSLIGSLQCSLLQTT